MRSSSLLRESCSFLLMTALCLSCGNKTTGPTGSVPATVEVSVQGPTSIDCSNYPGPNTFTVKNVGGQSLSIQGHSVRQSNSKQTGFGYATSCFDLTNTAALPQPTTVASGQTATVVLPSFGFCRCNSGPASDRITCGTSVRHEFMTSAGSGITDRDYVIDLIGSCLATINLCNPGTC